MSEPTSVEKSEEAKSKEAKASKEKAGSSTPILERPWYASYDFLGSVVGPLLPRFKGLKERLVKAGLPVDFRAYVSFLFFGMMLAFVVTFFGIWFLTFFVLRIQNLVIGDLHINL